MKTRKESRGGPSLRIFGKSLNGCALTRRVLLASALLAASIPAHAELLKLDETPLHGGGAALSASGRLDGKTYDISGKRLLPKKPTPGAALLVELNADDHLASIAQSRGMTVVYLDLTKTPIASRAAALRDLLPSLRDKAGAKRVLARGKGEDAVALVETGTLFDGLLIHGSDPFAAPIEPRGPKIIDVFTSDAYWRPGLAAIGAEAMEGANRRRFFIAGVAEAGATANCAAPINTREIAPALRALFVVLDDWTKGVKPPVSRAPRLHGAGLDSAKALLWPAAPGLPAPLRDVRPAPTIDPDGNETAGLRLPDHALPIATFTGFNLRKDVKGSPCLAGAAIPFAPTKAEREKTGDPRPSLVERYGSRAYFVATMRVVSDKLVKDRLLLQDDADAYVAAAKNAPF